MTRATSLGRPHILLVVADQLSARALAAYGNRVARTPHLDRVAEQGIVFERALCASPLCVPSRVALMTGLLPTRTGVFDNAAELPASVPTFAHHLRLAGYRTVLAGKMHFIGPDQLHGFEERPLPDVYPAGFDWIPDWRLEDHETLPWYHDLSSVLRAGPVRATLQIDYDAEVVHHARRAIVDSAREADRPLLLVASFTHPHDPYEAPVAYWDRYADVDVDAPTHVEPPDPADPPTSRLRAMVEAHRIPISDEQIGLARRGYYAALSLVDDHVGTLLDTLAEQGMADDTVVVFTSDHGDMLGERGLWYKMAPFEDSIRVPLVVHAPTRYAPKRVADPVSLLDLLPTLVDLCGCDDDTTDAADGVSLVPSFDGDAPPSRDIPLEYLAEGVRAPQVTLVRGPVKLIRGHREPDLVYDLDADPLERTSLTGGGDLGAVADARWNLERLDEQVRTSQAARRLVASALATGRRTIWDHPTLDPGGPYIRSGQDFWATLEAARRA
jgi:choline-sulfatase